MRVEMTYVALKPLRIGGQRRETGDLVPEAADWPRASSWISQGRIATVAKSSVDPELLKAAEFRYERAKAQAQAENSPSGEPQPESDHEVETFLIERGWYEIPGAEKKMRRDEAIQYLASLEKDHEE